MTRPSSVRRADSVRLNSPDVVAPRAAQRRNASLASTPSGDVSPWRPPTDRGERIRTAMLWMIVPIVLILASIAISAYIRATSQALPQSSAQTKSAPVSTFTTATVGSGAASTSATGVSPNSQLLLHSSYSGTLTDNARGLSSPMHLTNVVGDRNGKLSGRLSLDLTPNYDGEISGTILPSGNISVTVTTATNLTLTLVGKANPSGGMSGTALYDFGGETDDGTWTANPAA